MKKNPFCVSSVNKYFKDDVKNAHWIGHSILKSLYTDDLFKRTPDVDCIHAIVTDYTIKHPDSVKSESRLITRRIITRR